MALRGFVDLRLDAFLACAVMLPPLWFAFRMLKGDGQIPVRALFPPRLPCSCSWWRFSGERISRRRSSSWRWRSPPSSFSRCSSIGWNGPSFSVLLFFCCSLHYFLSRMDWDHWRVLPVAAAFLLPMLVMSRHEPGRTKYERTTAKGTAFAVLTAAIILLVSSAEFRTGFSWFPKALALLGDLVRQPYLADAERVLGPSTTPPQWAALYLDKDELKAVRYLRARTSPSTPIFVGVKDHSKVFWNALRVYG